jgi:hypothetical protein
MTLKDLIVDMMSGELRNRNYTLEQLLGIDLTKCSIQLVDEVSDLMNRVAQACEYICYDHSDLDI